MIIISIIAFVTIIIILVWYIHYCYKNIIKDVLKNMSTTNTLCLIDIDQIEDTILCNIQKKALHRCIAKAKTENLNAIHNTIERFITEGFDTNDLIDAINYIKLTDPIIHFGRQNMTYNAVNWLKKETKIKNGFELNNVYNSNDYCRKRWEKNLFGDDYSMDCDPVTRVKYGCLNLGGISGYPGAFHYGRSYLVLKPEVKSRITFIFGDSSSMPNYICTFNNFIQLFVHMDKKIIDYIIKMIKYNKGILKVKPYRPDSTYIETQIHGNLDVRRDCKHVMLYHMHACPQVLKKLKKDKIPYTIIY